MLLERHKAPAWRAAASAYMGENQGIYCAEDAVQFNVETGVNNGIVDNRCEYECEYDSHMKVGIADIFSTQTRMDLSWLFGDRRQSTTLEDILTVLANINGKQDC